MPRHSPKPHTGSGNSAQYLSLSVFVLLLAFFIVLSTTVTFKSDKVKPALESLQDSFSPTVAGEENLAAMIEDTDDESSDGIGDSIEDFEGVLKSSGIPFEAKPLRGNSVLYVRVEKNMLMEAMGVYPPTNKDGYQIFLSKLSIMLLPANDKVMFKISLMGLLPDTLDHMRKNAPDSLARSIRDMDRLAKAFLAFGIAPENLTVGFTEGNKDYMEIYFQPAQKNELKILPSDDQAQEEEAP